jgi:hypothetical protein
VELKFHVFIGYLVLCLSVTNVLSYNLPGFSDVALYAAANSSSLPTKHPPQALVNTTSNSICLVKVSHPDKVEYLTGVLIHPQLVVTNMHGLARFTQNPDNSSSPYGVPLTDPNSVQVYFGWKSGAQPSASSSGWKTIAGMDPTPSFKYLEKNFIYLDFVVLKLKDSDIQPSMNVAAYDNTLNSTNIPVRPFFIHHAGINPMIVSYDYNNDKSINFSKSGDYSIPGRGYKGWGGASGGGLFYSDDNSSSSKLLGLGCEFWPTTYYSGSGDMPYHHRGPRISCVFDQMWGAKDFVPNIMKLPLSYNMGHRCFQWVAPTYSV